VRVRILKSSEGIMGGVSLSRLIPTCAYDLEPSAARHLITLHCAEELSPAPALAADKRRRQWQRRREDRQSATVFHVVAPSGSSLTCVACEGESGLELRLVHGSDDVRCREVFSGSDRDKRLTDAAHSWRLALLKIGFMEKPL
jgi:hypothetical protein